MSELEMQLEEMLNIEGVRYFYHYTTKNGEDLLEDGIYLDEPNLNSISYELSEEEKENIMGLLCEDKRRADRNKEKGYVVIIACDDEFEIKPVLRSPYDIDERDKPFVICPEDLMASVDLDNGELFINDRSIVLGDFCDYPVR